MNRLLAAMLCLAIASAAGAAQEQQLDAKFVRPDPDGRVMLSARDGRDPSREEVLMPAAAQMATVQPQTATASALPWLVTGGPFALFGALSLLALRRRVATVG